MLDLCGIRSSKDQHCLSSADSRWVGIATRSPRIDFTDYKIINLSSEQIKHLSDTTVANVGNATRVFISRNPKQKTSQSQGFGFPVFRVYCVKRLNNTLSKVFVVILKPSLYLCNLVFITYRCFILI